MKTRRTLNGEWQWRAADEAGFRPGQVPGTVLGDLLRCGLIEDPYWRQNEAAARRWLEKDYLYRRDFHVPQVDIDADEVWLVCEGLDTLAAVTLNGTLVARVDDMHRPHRFPVKSLLAAGQNTIEVLFSSALRFARAADAAGDIFYTSTGSIRGNWAVRKAHSSFGWDWGPQLPDAGIWRDIYIESVSLPRLEDVRVRQRHLGGGRVVLAAEAAVTQAAAPGAGAAPAAPARPLRLEARVTAPGGEVFLAAAPTGAAGPPGTAEPPGAGGLLEVEVNGAELWWPNGLGPQPLYTLELRLLDEAGQTADRWERRIGLRTIELSREPDEWGSEFCFVVNGHKIFAMGANLIPEDSLLARVTPARTRALVQACADANFNCLRVWGGGYYPADAFYDACDELGILVWQDLMFACNVYPLNDHFEENIAAETAAQVRRLRHHACLALWCGNNEMEWGWGEPWKRLQGHAPRYRADYTKIFELVLPRAVAAQDDATAYWPSSPSSGGSFDFPNDPDRGDQHYWEVWHSGKPFTEYRAHHFRFCSEYGFQSFPHIKTLEAFTEPDDRNIFSRVMEAHQKNGAANGKILSYVSDYFLYPGSLAAIAYISQVLQLKAVQYGVEHWRQNRGRCMGSLYWQLNDCWPVASWAGIDYFGRWKALHYGARRFYAPVTASAREAEELSPRIIYYAHNDTLASRACTLEVALMDTALAEVYAERVSLTVPPLSAVPCLACDFTGFLGDEDRRAGLFARYRLYGEGEGAPLAEGTTLFVKPKHFAYPAPRYEMEVEDSGGAFTLTVRAGGFCQYVELWFTGCDAVFSDNFFDITSPEGVRVTVDKAALPAGIGARALRSQLRVRSVADSYAFDEPDKGPFDA